MIAKLSAIARRAILSAGPRYAPGLDPKAPNVEQDRLLEAISGLIVSDSFRDLVESAAANLLAEVGRATASLHGAHALERDSAQLGQLLNELASSKPGAAPSIISSALELTRKSLRSIGARGRRLQRLRTSRREEIRLARDSSRSDSPFYDFDDSVLRSISEKDTTLRRLQDGFERCASVLTSDACQIRFRNVVLLTGEWGTGKTHFLCDLARTLLASGKPAAIVLARDFEPSSSCGDSLAQATGLARSFEELLDKLDELGRSAGQRCLLLVDGINEADMVAWRRDSAQILEAAKRRPYVGLILSCREPFEISLFPARVLRRLPRLRHLGFSDVEFDAQRSFFDYYKIPLPEVPLLADEFSRPLTLKILCEAFQRLPQKQKARGFHGLSSGQKGMSFVLEHFIKERSERLQSQFGLPARWCWTLLKGDKGIQDPELSGFAPYMAHHLKEFVPYDAAIRIVRARPDVRTKRRARDILRFLAAEGVIFHHMHWRPESEGGPYQVVGFPYQRFTDHVIARHLLDRFLDTTSRTSVARSLVADSSLGRVFQIKHPDYPRFAVENWAEAVIVEFPEFAKRALPTEERELYFYLPKESQDLRAYFRPFVNGLVWRAPSSFSQQTDRIAGTYFWSRHEPTRAGMAEAFVSVATKPRHPYSGQRLIANLQRVPMRERDLTWSELVRKRDVGSAIERLVGFYEIKRDGYSVEVASNAIAALASILTTTDRALRDRATKALVMVGESQPAALFEFARESVNIDDPYVRERVLAAAYGVAMSLYSYRQASFRQALIDFAGWIAVQIFSPEGTARTSHSLLLGYALGIVELATYLNPNAIPKRLRRYVRRPFPGVPDAFPAPKSISSRIAKRVDDAIRMDFENYTIGRLIDGRRNYDMEHREFRAVRKQIQWRMADLGYDSKAFKAADDSIDTDGYRREQYKASRVDRYGKKYSWIAYFEAYGLRQARGLLDDDRHRVSDCDIDPSFPHSDPINLPLVPQLLERRPHESHVAWLRDGPTPNFDSLLTLNEIEGRRGPWVLVDGDIRERSPSDARRVWTWLDAILIDAHDVDRFRRSFLARDHPGSELSGSGEDHYTYAGEIGWSHRFGGSARSADGRLVDPTRRLFGEFKQVPARRRLKRGWYRLNAAYLSRYFGARSKRGRLAAYRSLQAHLLRVNRGLPEADRLSAAEVTAAHTLPSDHDLKRGYVEELSWEDVGGIDVEFLSWRFGWETYHSHLNQFTGFRVLSPWLCERFSLESRSRSINLVEPSGEPASFYLTTENEHWESGVDLLYLRQDLLETYLRDSNRTLLWIIWGERDLHHEALTKLRDDHQIRTVLTGYENVHRRLVARPK